MAELRSDIPGLDWSSIKAVLFDLDGTLYDQAPLRALMRQKLIKELWFRPWRWPEVIVIRCFRRQREAMSQKGVSPISRRQYESCAEKLGCSPARVEQIIDYWMMKAPLRHLAAYRPPGLTRFWHALQQAGKGIAVVSDFAARSKMAALRLDCPVIVSAEDPQVEVFKPDPKGFLLAADLLGLAPKTCLVIGDRMDRDGEAAKRAGMMYLHYAPKPPHPEGSLASYLDLIE